MRASVADVAAAFDAEPVADLVIPAETIEGQLGLVVYERNGRRHLRSMTWGFPRPSRSRSPSDTVDRVGMVADLTNPMWEKLVVDPRYRCLIPITHFANPDGVFGSKKRTWFSVKDQPIVAWAGFCRNLPEIGPAYAGMTMTANEAIPPTNDRMPVLLDPEDHDGWLHGDIREVIRLMYRAPLDAARMDVVRTDDTWRSGVAPPGTEPQMALL